jgi:hypothetical protein
MRSLIVSVLALSAIWAMNHDDSKVLPADCAGGPRTITTHGVRPWQPGDPYEYTICTEGGK